ncbi:MAG: GNAT family N-acetyltransferase [Prevotella sp.]|nr:GNAT family N-acetyltransferase [Prevotella sp.]
MLIKNIFARGNAPNLFFFKKVWLLQIKAVLLQYASQSSLTAQLAAHYRHTRRETDKSEFRSMKMELRKWSLTDYKELKDLCNAVDRSYLSDRLPNPYTEDDANWWLNMVAKSEGIDGTFRAMVVDGKIVGSVSVERKADIYRLDGELGYMLLKDYWNRGLMSQAVGQVCEIAIKELGLNRITANVFHTNIASQHILQKNGFKQEGIMRKAVIKEGIFYDILIYGLLK